MGALTQKLRQIVSSQSRSSEDCCCLLDISYGQHIDYPDDSPLPACPSIDAVKQLLKDESLIISVHTGGGYSFSSEYTEVYKGKFHASQAYEDLCAVLERALLGLLRQSPAGAQQYELSEDSASASASASAADSIAFTQRIRQYAAFIVQRAAWEAQLSHHVCERAFRERFPNLLEHPVAFDADGGFRYVEVFLGRSGRRDVLWDDAQVSPSALEALRFAVRTVAELHPPHTADERVQQRALRRRKQQQQDQQRQQLDANAAANDGDGRATIEAAADGDDVQRGYADFEDGDAFFVYYKHFQLQPAFDEWENSQAALPAAEAKLKSAADASTANTPAVPVPLPPPRRSSKRSGEGADAESEFDVFFVLPGGAEAGAGDEPSTSAAAAADGASGSEASPESISASAAAAARKKRRDDIFAADAIGRAQRSSCCQEMYAWGFDCCKSMGLATLSAGKKQKSSAINTGSSKHSSGGGSGSGGNYGGAGADSRREGDCDHSERDAVHWTPRRVPMHKLIAVERVKQISCSSNHSLLLTELGTAFGCGDNSEGALGVGDFLMR